ncbi:MAG: type II toxin-antitoxin system HicB family antitoxin [Spirochaetales bacterium]
MKQYVYPAVFYYNKEEDCYTVAFHDLQIYTEGDTVEKAFLSAKEFLEAYFECIDEFNVKVPEPSDYDLVVKENKNHTVLLVDVEI